jgi:hypothetical protein
MKTMKQLFIIVSLLFVAGMATAQDVIVKKDGSTISSKVEEINGTDIKYKKWGNLDGPLYSISRTEVLVINYQNGEIEVIQSNTNQTSDVNSIIGINRNSEMERSGRDLEIDGHELSDEEVLALVGPENYETYLSARKQVAVGRVFTPIFIVSATVTAVSGILYLVYLDEVTSGHTNYLNDMANALTVFAVFTSVTNVSLPLMIAFKSIGKKRLNWIADDYNHKNSAFSYQLSPSIIRCNIPQSQKGLGLGLTLNVNF